MASALRAGIAIDQDADTRPDGRCHDAPVLTAASADRASRPFRAVVRRVHRSR